MTHRGEQLAEIRDKLAKAKLIALYHDGDRLGAFKKAKSCDPELAAAFATEFAEGLRSSLRPATQRRRVAILLQAADVLKASPAAKSREGTDAIAWLLAEATLAEERERALRIACQALLMLIGLGALLFLIVFA